MIMKYKDEEDVALDVYNKEDMTFYMSFNMILHIDVTNYNGSIICSF